MKRSVSSWTPNDDGARDMTGHCRDWLAGERSMPYANTLELTRARASVNDAVDLFHLAIAKLEELGY